MMPRLNKEGTAYEAQPWSPEQQAFYAAAAAQKPLAPPAAPNATKSTPANATKAPARAPKR